MATAVEYRKLAEECFQWAREASDENVREHYASLGRIWRECAVRAEVRSGIITPSELQSKNGDGIRRVVHTLGKVN